MTCERLESIAAGLVGRPVYILLSSENADFGGEHIGGLYGRRADLQARDYLWNMNRWDGRRPAVFIDDLRADNDMAVLATMLHELAHYCDLGHDSTPETEVPAVSLQLARQIHTRTVSELALPVAYDEQHSSRFVRGCVHLWRRLQVQQAGLWCPPDWLWNGGLYGAPEPATAIRALSDEPERLAQLPVSLILDLPSTDGFSALFARE